MHYVGLDIHQRSTSVEILGSNGKLVKRSEWRLPWPQLADQLKKDAPTPFAVCFEASCVHGYPQPNSKHDHREVRSSNRLVDAQESIQSLHGNKQVKFIALRATSTLEDHHYRQEHVHRPIGIFHPKQALPRLPATASCSSAGCTQCDKLHLFLAAKRHSFFIEIGTRIATQSNRQGGRDKINEE